MATFQQAQGMYYRRYLSRLLERNLFDWYMEIGCRRGSIFRQSRGKTIAVDPFFQAEENIIGIKPSLHVFQQTSDDFFASGFLEKMEIKLSFSFLDGMHLFEYLLRDFIATEKASNPDGIIAMHDCCPFSYGMTTRDLDNLPSDAWSGDVWKLLPILRQYRPDLEITVLDAPPTGLVLVHNLDPGSSVLADAYDDILKTFLNCDLEEFGLAAFNECFEFTEARRFLKDGQTLFDKVTLPEDSEMVLRKVSP